MKTMKLIYPLVLTLAVAVVATGCHRGAPRTTPLPGPNKSAMVGGDTTSGTKGGGEATQGTALPPEPPIFAQPITTGGGDQSSPDLFEGMIKDTNTLAAYTVHFAFDSAVVKKSEHSNLQAVVTALTGDAGTKLLVEGNCDERGTEEYNRTLGERRALALREALGKLGIDPARIRTISYGKDRPADPGHDEAAWAKNRRGDFVLLHPKP